MDAHTLERLEFGKVLDRIATGAMLPLGVAAVRAMQPSTDLEAIRTLSERIAEGAAILASGHDFGVERFEDPSTLFDRAAIQGAALLPAEFQTVAAILRNADAFPKLFKRMREEAPRLTKLAADMAPNASLLESIERTILPDGSVADDASPELRRIRRAMEAVQGRIRIRLEALLTNADVQKSLTGDYVTVRNGRNVIPVVSTAAGVIPGIIHDRSDTGHTVFIEPQFVVEMGNELRSLAADEQSEILRILRELTTRVRDHLWGLRATVTALVEFDRVRAAARFGVAHQMTRPIFASDGVLRIVRGRHPVLEDALAKKDGKVVPLDFEMGGPLHTIAITGANAGGKTVSLKTIGMLCLMAQTGLLVPADDGSTFVVLDDVLVDIGDEQSIEANLSTFTGHIQHIRQIIAQSGPRTLVLLDEIGAGTDPIEGGALACAIIKALHDRGALTVCTTHLSQVKGFVHEHPGMENAAVQFDPETLLPTYQLVVGQPGASHALRIARRLGLPESVLTMAEGLVDSKAIEMEGLLARLTMALAKAEADAETARRERAEAEEARQQIAKRLDQLKKDRKDSLRRAVEEARGLVDNTRREMEKALEEARRMGADASAASTLRRQVEVKREGFKKKAKELAPSERASLPFAALYVGQSVWVESMKRLGTIAAIDIRRSKVTVDSGGLAIEVDPSSIKEPTENAASPGSAGPTATSKADGGPARGEPSGGRTIVRRPASVAPEISLRGMRVEEAMRALELYLNEACLGDVDHVRIIHGFGTGAMQKAVHAFLTKHPLIASFHYGEQSEGGRGATIAVLK
jgi:DNA mismatch repair protein MutS2